MRRFIRQSAGFLLGAFLLGSFLIGSASAEFNYESYKPYSIRAAIGDHSNAPELDNYFIDRSMKYRVRAKIVGKIREIDRNIPPFLEKWNKTGLKNDSFVSMFQHEILVREGYAEFWLPIQEKLLEEMRKEVEAGRVIDLYIHLLGMTKYHDESGAVKKIWVITINEFQIISDR